MTLQLLLKLEKMIGPLLSLVVEFASFLALIWTRYGPLAKNSSGNPDAGDNPDSHQNLVITFRPIYNVA